MKIMLQLSKHQNKYIDLCSTDNATSKEKHRRCASPLLHISYLEHTTNDWVQSKINFLVDPQEPLLATIKRRKLAWFEHNTCHDSLSKPIFQGTLEGRRHRGRQRKSWMDKIKEWTSLPMPELLKRASCKKKDWKRISAESSLKSPWWPKQSWDRTASWNTKVLPGWNKIHRVWFTDHIISLSHVWRGPEKNNGEWTGKAKIRKANFPAASK